MAENQKYQFWLGQGNKTASQTIKITGAGSVSEKITLKTAGKFVDRNIEVNASVVTEAGSIALTATNGHTYSINDLDLKSLVKDNDGKYLIYVNDGYLADQTIQVPEGSIANVATKDAEYTVNSDDSVKLAKGSDDKYWLYINQGWHENSKIDLGTMIPDGSEPNATSNQIMTGADAWNEDGQRLVGTMPATALSFSGGAITGQASLVESSLVLGDDDASGISIKATATATRAAVKHTNTQGDYSFVESGQEWTMDGATEDITASDTMYVQSITIADDKALGSEESAGVINKGTVYVSNEGEANVANSSTVNVENSGSASAVVIFAEGATGTASVDGVQVAKEGALITATMAVSSDAAAVFSNPSTGNTITAKGSDGVKLFDTAAAAGSGAYEIEASAFASNSGVINATVNVANDGWILAGNQDVTGEVSYEEKDINKSAYIAAGTISIPAADAVTSDQPNVNVADAATGFTPAASSTHYITITTTPESGSVTPKYTTTEGYIKASEKVAGEAITVLPTVNIDSKTIYIPDAAVTVKGGEITGSVTSVSGASNVVVSEVDTVGAGIEIVAAASANRSAIQYDGAVDGYVTASNGTTVSGGTAASKDLVGKSVYVQSIAVAAGKTFGSSEQPAITVDGEAYVADTTDGTVFVDNAGTTEVINTGAVVVNTKNTGTTTVTFDAGSTGAATVDGVQVAKDGALIEGAVTIDNAQTIYTGEEKKNEITTNITTYDTAAAAGEGYYTINAKATASGTAVTTANATVTDGWVVSSDSKEIESSSDYSIVADAATKYIAKGAPAATAAASFANASYEVTANNELVAPEDVDTTAISTVAPEGEYLKIGTASLSIPTITAKADATAAIGTEGYVKTTDAAATDAKTANANVSAAYDNQYYYIPVYGGDFE